ncbi:beta-ketoacyl-ACP synthase III [Streptomyces sp. NPDC050095]|uniref:beta-ketoacyl-ACP synthase III n=1 Tax=unclassified Streptomyces TaxID=2593676 RepID=UPI00341B1A5F
MMARQHAPSPSSSTTERTTGVCPAAVLSGLGAWLPPQVIGNQDLVDTHGLDTTDEWIRQRTGILRRHRAAPGVSTSDLAVEAGRRALRSAGSGKVDAVVLATTTPDHPCPATAPAVATRLGLTGVAAFDIAAVCSGFLYALQGAAGLIATGVADRVLVIGADTYSTILDPDDRTTMPLFGDGAGAAVLRAGSPTEHGALGPAVLGSDGTGSEYIRIPAGGARQRSRGRPPGPGEEYFRMQGQAVFRTAVDAMAAAAGEAMRRAGWEPSDVSWLAAHQANARILGAVARELPIDSSRCLSNIADVGNTAAASIPILLTQAARRQDLKAGDKVVLTAFGGGLTWGAVTVTWPRLTVTED